MIIDIYTHLVSDRVLRLVKDGEKLKDLNPPAENGEIDARLSVMDRYGIDIHALSPTTPVLMGLNAEDAAKICKISNDDNYLFCKAHPDRFVNICMFSLLDVDAALVELKRCIEELDCRGVTISSNQNGKGIDSPEYLPFYEQVAEHELPILIHPVDWGSYPLVDRNNEMGIMGAFGWPFDTTQAVWRLIFGGVLDHYPTLKIITHHLGGMLPYFAGRVKFASQPLVSRLARPLEQYWANIYGDTAVTFTPAALPCGYAFFGAERMVYASDYPFSPHKGEPAIRDHLAYIKAMDISEYEKELILGRNAKRLLKIA